MTCRLRIEADDVTVDLNGHTLFGGLISSGDHVTVRNGVVDGVHVWLQGTGYNRLERIEVRNVAWSWAVTPGGRTVITDSRFVNNVVAIDLYLGGGTTVQRSTFIGNRIGVNVAKDRGTVIRNNRFIGNGRGVNIWDEELGYASGTVVTGNLFTGNDIGARLFARNQADNTRFTGNIFRGNLGPGLEVDVTCGRGPLGTSCGGEGTLIGLNLFIDNGGTGGLWVHGAAEAAAGVIVRRNVALRNDAARHRRGRGGRRWPEPRTGQRRPEAVRGSHLLNRPARVLPAELAEGLPYQGLRAGKPW